jgi:Putative peptidoglycan binding domain
MRALVRGQRGPDVTLWQRFLVGQKLLDGGADGIFGAQTDAATRAFQRREGLAADGIVGEKTLGRAQTLGFRAYRRLRDGEVTPALRDEAKRLLSLHWREPFGAEYPFEIGGRSYFGRVEQHYHPPGGSEKPWGYHTGISLFVAITLGLGEPVHDDADGRPS